MNGVVQKGVGDNNPEDSTKKVIHLEKNLSRKLSEVAMLCNPITNNKVTETSDICPCNKYKLLQLLTGLYNKYINKNTSNKLHTKVTKARKMSKAQIVYNCL